MTLLAKYEYHATHGGWHLHSCCETDNAIAGRTSGHFKRLPLSNFTSAKNIEFGVDTETDADKMAIRAFGIGKIDCDDLDMGDLFS